MNIERITVDPNVCQSIPAVRGTRVTVSFILKLLGNGYSVEDVLREYPALEREDIHQCATYGA